MNYNLLLDVDSYKFSHYRQYPKDAHGYYGYVESRGGKFKHVLMFGLQYLLKEYLSKPFTRADIEEAALFSDLHGVPFNREGWEYILKNHRGHLPIKIKSVAEGTLVPTGNAMLTIESTDDKVFWLPSVLETMILRNVWYASTVATVSYECKQIFLEYIEKTGASKDILPFMLHDFGARGVSSYESSMLGGAAHLVNFAGSDTVAGVRMANKIYGNQGEMFGFSVPAAEHSTITSWGRENEENAFRNMLQEYARPGKIVSVVSDSYNIYDAVDKLWGQNLKREVIESGATLVIRPDSGNPKDVVLECLKLVDNRFKSTINKKGFKVLNNVKIIQGDGVNLDSIREICEHITLHGFCISNMVFGMGGALLQKVDRDTQKFALKCSAIKRSGKWFDVYKDPIDDTSKASKWGRLHLYRKDDDFITSSYGCPEGYESALEDVFEDGKILKETSMQKVRSNTKLW